MAHWTAERWKQLSPLLDQALELEPAERARFVNDLRSNQPEWADELSTLLEQSVQAEAAEFMHRGPTLSSAEPTLAGQQMGAYVLTQPLGYGGMGSVWLAQRNDGRYEGHAAIKLLNLSLVGRSSAERFRREGTILATLKHPNIAQLIDAGISGAGQPYLVLEYVAGQFIDLYCDAHRLSIRQRIDLFLKVLDGVSHAHSHLVVHRDIKPSNVMVTQDGQVKLLDFGIAKLLQDDTDSGGGGEQGTTALTRLGANPLTPDYAAPEQIEGAPITTATDVYALGVMLYVLLSGKHPTAGHAASSAMALKAVLEDTPRKLSDAVTQSRDTTAADASGLAERRTTTPKRLVSLVSGDLDNILAKALKKIPAERYKTVNEFAEDLQRHLKFEPVLARADSWSYSVGRFVRRHRGSVLAGLTAVCALVTGLSVAVWQRNVANQEAERANAARNQALTELTYSEALNDFTAYLLSTGNDKPFTTADLLTKAEKAVRNQYVDQPILRTKLQVMVAHQFMSIGDFSRAESLISDAQKGNSLKPNALVEASINCTRGLIYIFDDRQAQARTLLDNEISRLRTNHSPTAPELVYCLNVRGRLHFEQHSGALSLADIEDAISSMGNPRPGQRMQLINLQERLASTYSQLGRAAESIRLHHEMLAQLRELNREITPIGANLWAGLGTASSFAGQWANAVGELESSFRVSAMVEKEANARIASNLGVALAETGQYARAQTLLESVLVRERREGRHESTGLVALRLGRVYCESNQSKLCREMIALAKANLPRGFPPNDYVFGSLYLLEALAAESDQNVAVALQMARSAHQHFTINQAPKPLKIRAAAALTRAETKNGNYNEAQIAAEQSLRVLPDNSLNGEFNSFIGEALMAYAELHLRRGQRDLALEAITKAIRHLEGGAGSEARTTIAAKAFRRGL
ncbi:MAG: serine/threonine protein kinase [Betaproteobacteria bacterium]|nr:MAG: serine/threonine protein kinase [Betaproteobacteria bacterium]